MKLSNMYIILLSLSTCSNISLGRLFLITKKDWSLRSWEDNLINPHWGAQCKITWLDCSKCQCHKDEDGLGTPL